MMDEEMYLDLKKAVETAAFFPVDNLGEADYYPSAEQLERLIAALQQNGFRLRRMPQPKKVG